MLKIQDKKWKTLDIKKEHLKYAELNLDYFQHTVSKRILELEPVFAKALDGSEKTVPRP